MANQYSLLRERPLKLKYLVQNNLKACVNLTFSLIRYTPFHFVIKTSVLNQHIICYINKSLFLLKLILKV